MRQELTFNGKALSEFGLWYDGSVSFGSPERDVELVEVVGRNGALSISNDRFRNIEITFPCAIRSNFITNYRNLMAFLNSSKGYCRLETTQEPNYYRLALFMNQTNPTGYKLNTHGRFDLVFQVMPQRFLKTGETTTSVSSSSSDVSGNPVSISNPSGLTSLTGLSVDIEPVQSGEGDPSPSNVRPIIAANGINVWDEVWELGGISNQNGTNYGASDRIRSKNYIPCLPSTTYYFKTPATIGTVAFYNSSQTFISALSNFAGGTFTTPANTQYIRFCGTNVYGATYNHDISINYPSTYTAYQPYQGIMVERVGKNLLKNTATSKTESGITFTVNADGTVTANGTSTALINPTVGRVYVTVGETYILKATSGGSLRTYKMRAVVRDANGVAINIGGTLFQDAYNGIDKSITMPSNASYMDVYCNVENGQTITNALYEPMVRLASVTDSTYEPYTSASYPYSLGQSVYGGSVDLATGVLTVDRVSVDLGSLNWAKGSIGASGKYRFVAPLTGAKPSGSDTTASNILSTVVKANTPSEIWDGADGITIASASANMILRIDAYNGYTVTELKAALVGQTAVYELDTPTTVQLTAQQVSLLTGTNIISTDMNSLTVTIASPAELENPTLFESKPIIRVYGNGTLNVNDIYITVANSPYTYIDIDCELMDCYYGSNNANQYVSFSTTDYVTLRSGMNYFSYSGFTQVQVTPRWFEV